MSLLQHMTTVRVISVYYIYAPLLPLPIGDVMKESAQISLNWVRANAAKVGTDVHAF